MDRRISLTLLQVDPADIGCLNCVDDRALILVERGQLTSDLADLRCAVREGSLASVTAAQARRLRAESRTSLLAFAYRSDMLDALETLDLDAGLFAQAREIAREPRFVRCDPEVAVRVQELAMILVREGSSDAAGRLPGSDALLVLALVELLVITTRAGLFGRRGFRGERNPERGAARDDPWTIDEVIARIEANYADRFSLAELVAACALNTSEFSRRFKARAGCPLFEFINRQRVKRACSLLKDSGMPIVEIAFAVGYNNLSFFNRYFHRIMGNSPREYRLAARR
ncbi:MAG: hypothetical protein A2Z99_11460 [Treponema sp. GWB1_62_6]|nr:MAG: hypothetical protein A2Z99_11460 [Treponema sp. GWB1_62_6]